MTEQIRALQRLGANVTACGCGAIVAKDSYESWHLLSVNAPRTFMMMLWAWFCSRECGDKYVEQYGKDGAFVDPGGVRYVVTGPSRVQT